MRTYKLKYNDNQSAMSDLINKGIYVETSEGLIFGDGVYGVVAIGLIETGGVYDDNFNVITPSKTIEGFHYDILAIEGFDFGVNEIFPKNPIHGFYGV